MRDHSDLVTRAILMEVLGGVLFVITVLGIIVLGSMAQVSIGPLP